MTIKGYAIEKVVLFGDSLMAGYGLLEEHHLSVVLEESLQLKGYDIEVINGSVSGSTSSGGLNRAEWTLSEPNIDLMILCLGANDMLRGIKPSETKKNLENIIKIAKRKKIKIIAINKINKNIFIWLSLKIVKKLRKLIWTITKKGRLPITIKIIAIIKILLLSKKAKELLWVENPPVDIVVKLCAIASNKIIPLR